MLSLCLISTMYISIKALNVTNTLQQHYLHSWPLFKYVFILGMFTMLFGLCALPWPGQVGQH